MGSFIFTCTTVGNRISSNCTYAQVPPREQFHQCQVQLPRLLGHSFWEYIYFNVWWWYVVAKWIRVGGQETAWGSCSRMIAWFRAGEAAAVLGGSIIVGMCSSQAWYVHKAVLSCWVIII